MKGKFFRIISRFVVIICISVVVIGCDILPRGPVDRAVTSVDRGIDAIRTDSDQWRSTLQQVADELPSEIQGTIRVEMNQLVAKSIARSGDQFMCLSDFYAERAIQGLQRIWAMLKNEVVPAVEPKLCQVIDSSLDLNLSPERRRTIEVHGYDMNTKDKDGQLLQVSLFSEITGDSIQLPEDRIGRNTHYMLTLNVSGPDFERLLSQRKIAKIRFLWGDMSFPYEVVVIPKELQSKTIDVPPGSISHTPLHTGGDGDFDTSDGDPMNFVVKGESNWLGNELKVRVYMYGRETEDDYTEVKSWSGWKTIYTTPQGWQIVSYSPSGPSEHSGAITDHNIRTEKLPGGELVERFEIYGDRDDDEAGTYTQVIAYFNPVKVTIAEISPVEGMEWNKDRPGLDYRHFDLKQHDPNLCLGACQQDSRCKAWTYVGGFQPHCWLKSEVPPPKDNGCCVSGKK